MGSQFETGHAKNVATFNSLVSFCQGYGNAYNPAVDGIKLSNLQTLAASAQAALEDCKSKQLDFDQAVDARMLAFSALRPLAQKVIYALKASGAPALSIEAAMTIYRKIQGRRKKAKEDESETVAVQDPQGGDGMPVNELNGDPNAQQQQYISVSQLSFDNLLANFSSLVELLGKVSEYQPNEMELQVTSLKDYVNELKSANLLVIDLYTTWSNIRIGRNVLLYGKGSGLVDLAGQIKNYVKSIYGLQSPQYKQMTGLQFSVFKN